MIKFELSKRSLLKTYNIDDLIKQIVREKKSLKTVSLHHFNEEEIGQFVRAMHCCLNLEEIDLSENGVEDLQVPLIVQLVAHLPNIHTLNMSHSFLSERGIILLSEACCLKNVALDISFNRMSHERTAIYQENFCIPPFELRFDNNSFENIKSRIPINPQTLISLMPNYQQDYTYDCGATTILNINEYFNTVLKKASSTLTLRELVTSVKTCEIVGAEIESMMAWFEIHDYDVIGGFGGTEKMLRYYTGLGIPVIINTNEWGGHYIIVIGFEAFDPVWPQKDKIWCCDPLDYQNGDFDPTKPYAKKNLFQFLNQWLDSKGRRGGYIVALPREISNLYPDWIFKEKDNDICLENKI